MKWLAAILVSMLIGLQIRIWSEDGGLPELNRLALQVAEQKAANEKLKARNQDLQKHVVALRNDDAVIEQYARYHLGMVKPGETFYRFVPSNK